MIRFLSCRDSDQFHTYLKIFTKKIKKKHSAININVTCKSKSNNFSEQWFCTDGWSDEKCLGKDVVYNSCMKVNNTDVFIYNFEVYVNTCELTVIGLPFYKDELFTDFKLSTEDGVGVYKVILAAHSDMLKTMLNGEWKETAEGRIEIAGASLQTLQALKDYLYLGTSPEEGLLTLLQIAIRFFIESLKKECVIRLAQNVEPEDYIQLLDFARNNEIAELTSALLQLTPKEVITPACEMFIESKQLPEVDDNE